MVVAQIDIGTGGLPPLVLGSILEIAQAALAVDGVDPLSGDFRRALGNPAAGDRARHWVARADDGVITGYAGLITAPDGAVAAEIVVDPAFRRLGFGTELVAAVRGAAPAVQIWAHGNTIAAQEFSRSDRTWEVSRTLLQMRRSLVDLPPPAAPEGLTIRGYRGSADDAELLRLNNAAFSWHPEQGGWGVAQLAERMNEDWFDPDGLLIAETDGYTTDLVGAAGFHWTKVHPPEAGIPLGEVYVVAVDPRAQGHGVGNALTRAGLHYLAGALGTGPSGEPANVHLYVEGDNTAALATYRRLGFVTYREDVAYGAAPTPTTPS